MLLISAKNGKTTCDMSCPFYEERGYVRQIGGLRATCCRLSMENWWLNCDRFDVRNVQLLEITDDEWKRMLASVKRKARKVRRPYPKDRLPEDKYVEP